MIERKKKKKKMVGELGGESLGTHTARATKTDIECKPTTMSLRGDITTSYEQYN